MDYEKSNDITDILQNLITLYFKKDYKSICKILEITYNPKYNHKNSVNFINNYYDNGMEFVVDDNPLKRARVYIDDETKIILDTLYMVTYNSIDKRVLIDTIIKKWIDKIYVNFTINRKDVIETVGKETRIVLEVGDRTWNNLSITCNNKCINIKEGFKMSIFNYLNEISIDNLTN